MEQVVLFIFTFIVVFLIYSLTSVRSELIKEDMKKNPQSKKNVKRRTKGKKKYDEAVFPVEVQYIVLKYDVDLKKVNYRSLLFSIAGVVALDLSITATIVSFISGIVWQLLVGFVVLIPIILASFHVLGVIYQKKGKKKNV